MTNCAKCKLEISSSELVKCAECEVELHKKCSRKYNDKRYCRKCRKAADDDDPTWLGME